MAGAWLPLESNPDVLNPFVRRLGVPDTWGFADVFGLDPELLMMVPQPCAALCLLYPSSKINQVRRAELSDRAKDQPAVPDELFFLTQHDGIGNACGTIACIHACANASLSNLFTLDETGPLATFMREAQPLGIAERGWALLKAKALQELSDETAASGETEGAGTDDAQGQHFIAFVNVKGMLYELDGRNLTGDSTTAIPICHGATSAETFVADAAAIIRDDFMARDPCVLRARSPPTPCAPLARTFHPLPSCHLPDLLPRFSR